jgi:hypothetical protein
LWICEIFPVLLVGLFPVAAVGKDRLGSALVEVIAQFGAVIGVAKIERIFGVAVEVLPDLQACGRDAVDHRPISEHRQVEAVTVEGNELGA